MPGYTGTHTQLTDCSTKTTQVWSVDHKISGRLHLITTRLGNLGSYGPHFWSRPKLLNLRVFDSKLAMVPIALLRVVIEIVKKEF